jgi:4-amino-4-deoxy-L-arabinose transferase-like glycosyltransferase
VAEPDLPAPAPSAHAWLVTACVALGCLGVVGLGAARLSPTVDEPLHLVRGVAFFCSQDLRLNYAHPPLANALAALPAVLTRGCVALERMPGWSEIDHSQVARSWVATDYEELRARLVSARWISVASVLGIVVFGFYWVSRRWGSTAGIAYACLTAANPTLLAHGELVTTDAPISLCALLCVAALADHLERRTRRTRAWLVAAAAAAAATKHTAIPALALLAVTHALFTIRKPRDLGAWLLEWSIVAAACVLVVDTFYRFDGVFETLAQWKLRKEPANWLTGYESGSLLDGNALLSHLPDGLPMPLPYTYVIGLLTVGAQNAHEGTSWLFGLTRGGSPLYFPVLLLAKQPVASLVAQGASLVTRRQLVPVALRHGIDAAFVWAALFLGLACTSHINIGVRHVLPLVPVLALPAALWAARLWEREKRWAAAGALSLLVAVGVDHADYLGYFNLLVGGRQGGHAISMIGEDWGQDTRRVAELLRARNITRVRYAGSWRCLGAALRSAELERYGVHVEPGECNADARERGEWVLVERTFALRHYGCNKRIQQSPRQEVLLDHWHLFQPGPARDEKARPRKRAG